MYRQKKARYFNYKSQHGRNKNICRQNQYRHQRFRKTGKNAKVLNTEVVMAITLLHHNELKDLESKMFDHNITSFEKEKLFEARKNEFFNKLQFSYNDYVTYITEHSTEINEYIISHPEITNYLATENRG